MEGPPRKTGLKKRPKPPRKTMVLEGEYAKPNRGLRLRLLVLVGDRWLGLANRIPPTGWNCATGIWGMGLAAHAFSAAAVTGFGEVRSKPLVMRLYRSVGGISNSSRNPMFRVSV